MRVLSALICSAAAILLGGCISSDTPLIPASQATMAFEAGTYIGGATEDVAEMQDKVIVKRRADDYVVTKTVLPNDSNKLEKPQTTTYTVRFQRLDEDHYIAQVREAEKTATPYQYAFVYSAPDGMVKFYAVRCDKFLKSGRVMQAYDMTTAKAGPLAGQCAAKSSDGLVAFMREIPLVLSEFTELNYAIQRLP